MNLNRRKMSRRGLLRQVRLSGRFLTLAKYIEGRRRVSGIVIGFID